MGEARRAAGQELPLAKEVMGRMERKAAVWQKLRWHSPRPVARVSVIVGGILINSYKCVWYLQWRYLPYISPTFDMFRWSYSATIRCLTPTLTCAR